VRKEESNLVSEVMEHDLQQQSFKSGHLGESTEVKCRAKDLKRVKTTHGERRVAEHLVENDLLYGGEEMRAVRGLIRLRLHFVLREPPSVIQQHIEAAPRPISHIAHYKRHWKKFGYQMFFI
jgi:hypothetical protein